MSQETLKIKLLSQFLLDSPITTIDDDDLSRKQMLHSIVSAIENNRKETHNCYTIGIYGKWGEGKTSVLNMVCNQLSKKKKVSKTNKESTIEIFHFNPWLFKDQESLLLNFFITLQI